MLASGERRLPFAVFQTIFVQNVYDITAETRNASIQPKAHHILNGVYNGFVFIVQVGLLLGEKVEIVFSAKIVELPAVLAEKAAPVRGILPVLARVPDIVVGVGLNFSAAFLEPLVPVGCVVNDKVEDYFYVQLFRLFNKLVHVLKAAVVFVNIAVVAYVVSVIPVWRGIGRREPKRPDTERF